MASRPPALAPAFHPAERQLAEPRRADIERWIKGWNDDPKPCVWAKPGQAIFDDSPDTGTQLMRDDAPSLDDATSAASVYAARPDTRGRTSARGCALARLGSGAMREAERRGRNQQRNKLIDLALAFADQQAANARPTASA
jgi:hypothetical protein